MGETELLYSDLTYKVIGAAMEVHKNLGAGFLESVYEEALAYEFELQNILYERQKNIIVYYKNKKVKQFISDFMVDEKVVVEIKAIKNITDIEKAQLINYLKATGLKVGMLFNFGADSLEYKRFVN
ncbi:MAG: GxxExxY protein [Sedimentisphaerales bacterium]|nr:GxxExxY protein [Sedimentisphaerales bacterium]